jgi:hypothetical protein
MRGITTLAIVIVLTGCSSMCVTVDAVPVDAAGNPIANATPERLGIFSTGAQFLDPILGGMASQQSMLDAASLAGHLAGGTAPVMVAQYLATGEGPIANLQAVGQQLLGTVLGQEETVRDHDRALAEIGLRLATDLESQSPNAVALATQSLFDAYAARRHRILTPNVAAATVATTAPPVTAPALAPAVSSPEPGTNTVRAPAEEPETATVLVRAPVVRPADSLPPPVLVGAAASPAAPSTRTAAPVRPRPRRPAADLPPPVVVTPGR